MKKIKTWYSSLNLQQRLFFSYICLILTQLLIFGIVYYRVASDSILDVAKENALDVTVKNLNLMEERFQEIEKQAQWVCEEREVKDALERIQKAQDSEIIALDRVVNSVLNKYFYEENVVSSYLVTPEHILGNNSQVRVPASQFYQSQVYRRISEQEERGMWTTAYSVREEYQLDWSVEQSAIFTYLYRLDDPVSVSGENQEERKTILLVNLKTDLFRKIFEEGISDEETVYCISNQEGEIIVHADEDKEGTTDHLPWLGQPSGNRVMVEDYQGQKSVICYAVSKRTGWIAAVIYPVSGLLGNVRKMQYFTFGMAGLLFALALLMATFFARRITEPIEKLTDAMKKAEEGDFSNMIPVNGNDEIQYLVSRYNEMGMKIEKLIEENYKGEIRNKESEIMALNLQLKPHFLYNTLNVINLMALEEGEMEISRMIISVSDMMQYTFRNKQEMVKLEDELGWLKNYIYIMEHRFEGKFRVEYQIEEGISEYMVPKLLLQPLAENAIIHGFKKMESGGVLGIFCKSDKNKIYFRVTDNGQGFSVERLEAVLDGTSGRTGIMNVKKRLALIYGEEAKIEIETEMDKGCRVLITLPGRLKS